MNSYQQSITDDDLIVDDVVLSYQQGDLTQTFTSVGQLMES